MKIIRTLEAYFALHWNEKCHTICLNRTKYIGCNISYEVRFVDPNDKKQDKTFLVLQSAKQHIINHINSLCDQGYTITTVVDFDEIFQEVIMSQQKTVEQLLGDKGTTASVDIHLQHKKNTQQFIIIEHDPIAHGNKTITLAGRFSTNNKIEGEFRIIQQLGAKKTSNPSNTIINTLLARLAGKKSRGYKIKFYNVEDKYIKVVQSKTFMRMLNQKSVKALQKYLENYQQKITEETTKTTTQKKATKKKVVKKKATKKKAAKKVSTQIPGLLVGDLTTFDPSKAQTKQKTAKNKLSKFAHIVPE